MRWPCYFHADWADVFPLLAKRKRFSRGYHDSDFRYIPYPDVNSQIEVKSLEEIAARADAIYTNEHGSDASQDRTEKTASLSGYVTEGVKTTFKGGEFALLFLSQRDDRFASWVDGLKIYAGGPKTVFSGDVSQKWEFDTYGGGGAFVYLGGDIVLNQVQVNGRGEAVTNAHGEHVKKGQLLLNYAGYGPGFATKSWLPKTLFKRKIPWAAGAPNRFYTAGIVMKNLDVFGTTEPEAKHFGGMCLIFNGGAAFAEGFADDGPRHGYGGDVTCMMIFGSEDTIPRPTILFMMLGKSSGVTLGVGVYIGYVNQGPVRL
jgi:hypothetical protein